ncbi:MAG: CDP-alcohol phosphatidyltransferase family protein [Bacteroidales bacterium]
MAIKKHIPNTITLFNLLCGCIAIVFVFEDKLAFSAYLIGLAAVFDFLDGMAARLLHVKSLIGKELDSLADVVSFGLVPGFILFRMISYSAGYSFVDSGYFAFLPYIALLIPAFSALRLAKFNTDERQQELFIGLPTPANAILIASLPLILLQDSWIVNMDMDLIKSLIQSKYFLIFLTFLLSYLLVAEIPLFSLKFKTFIWHENKLRFTFLGISIIALILFYYLAIPMIIILYIGLSLSPKNLASKV